MLQKVRRSALAVLSTLVLGIIIAVAAEPIVAWVGYNKSHSPKLVAYITAFRELATQTWFLVATVFLASLTLGLWLERLLQTPSAQRKFNNLDDLYAEGIRHRDRLVPTILKFDHEAERAVLHGWKERALQALRDAGVSLSERSDFRTLNFYDPKWHEAQGKSVAQKNLEANWNESLDRLHSIIFDYGQ